MGDCSPLFIVRSDLVIINLRIGIVRLVYVVDCCVSNEGCRIGIERGERLSYRNRERRNRTKNLNKKRKKLKKIEKGPTRKYRETQQKGDGCSRQKCR